MPHVGGDRPVGLDAHQLDAGDPCGVERTTDAVDPVASQMDDDPHPVLTRFSHVDGLTRSRPVGQAVGLDGDRSGRADDLAGAVPVDHLGDQRTAVDAGSGVPLTSTWRMPVGLVGGEALGVGREVAHPPQRAGGDRVGVEHDDVGAGARPQLAAVGEAEQVGLHAR